MIVHQHLDRAPITEALIDIQVKLPDQDSREALMHLTEELKSQYPTIQELKTFSGKIEIRPEENPIYSTENPSFIGFRCETEDSKYVVQLRNNGFTLSRLAPYETWGDLRGEAFGLWQQYVRITKPEFITRVALRYINKIELPLPIIQFDEYLKAPPSMPKNIDVSISEFLTRIIVHNPELDARGIIIQAFEGVVKANALPILVDIDVFREARLDIEGDHVWEYLDSLRSFKNDIFFESLTNKALELCK